VQIDGPPEVSCLYSVMSRLSAVGFPDERDAIIAEPNGVEVKRYNGRSVERWNRGDLCGGRAGSRVPGWCGPARKPKFISDLGKVK
jgi:hypothetical protein